MRAAPLGGRGRGRWGTFRCLWRLRLTSDRCPINVAPMRDAIAPQLGMICRYTDPDGNTYDAMVLELEGAQAFIEYRPATRIMSVSRWVNYFTLSVPR